MVIYVIELYIITKYSTSVIKVDVAQCVLMHLKEQLAWADFIRLVVIYFFQNSYVYH